MNSVTINGKPGVRISGTLIKKVSDKAGVFDCEGDHIFLPLFQVTIEEKTGSIIMPCWLYNEKFEKK